MSSSAVIYVRVSTADQVENLSLDTQELRSKEFCAREGLSVNRVFREEGASAKTTGRQELQKMLTFLKKEATTQGITTVVIYRVDRFSRVVRDYQELIAQLGALGLVLRSATEMFDGSPSGRLQENVLAAFAQFDNDQRSARTKEGMRAAMALGRWVWKPPIGYLPGDRSGPSMQIDPIKSPLVITTFERVGNGESKQLVRNEMAALGLVGSTGRPLSTSRFDEMILNPLYRGRIVRPDWDIDVAGDFTPMVSEEVWNRANVIRKRRTKKSQGHDNTDFPLRKTVCCSSCGYRLTGSTSKGRKDYYSYYTCWNPSCKAVSVRSEALESLYEGLLTSLSVSQPILDLFEASMLSAWKERQRTAARMREEISKKLLTAEQRLVVLTDRYLDQKIDEALFNEQHLRLKNEITTLRELSSPTSMEEQTLLEATQQCREIFTDLGSTWNRLESQQRPQFVGSLHPEGLITDGTSLRTTETPWFTRVMTTSEEDEHRLAVPTGFEPVSSP